MKQEERKGGEDAKLYLHCSLSLSNLELFVKFLDDTRIRDHSQCRFEHVCGLSVLTLLLQCRCPHNIKSLRMSERDKRDVKKREEIRL